MPLSLEATVRVKEKARADTRRPKTQALIKALFMYLSQHKGNPPLQLVPLDAVAASAIIMDAPCRLYAVFIKAGAAATLPTALKVTDSATVGSDTAFAFGTTVNPGDEDFLAYPDGKPLAGGLSVLGNTTMAGAVGAGVADRPSGFVIIGG